MPCYTISETGIDINRPDLGLLEKALESIGYVKRPQKFASTEGLDVAYYRDNSWTMVGLKNGELRVMIRDGSQMTDTDAKNEVQRAYSAEIVKHVSQRYGWRLQQKSDRKFVAARRG
jgi:hypothetical protein